MIRVSKPFVVLAALLLLSTASCSKSSKKSGSGELAEGDIAGSTTGLSDEDLALQNQKRFGGGNIPMAEAGGMFQDVYFEFNASSVSSDQHDAVRQNAEKLQQDPNLKVQVEGHCDKRGTSEYNMALGEERAKSVAKLLTTYGVKPSQLSIVSYGEEVPLDPSEGEAAYAKNRRAHIALVNREGGEGNY